MWLRVKEEACRAVCSSGDWEIGLFFKSGNPVGKAGLDLVGGVKSEVEMFFFVFWFF